MDEERKGGRMDMGGHKGRKPYSGTELSAACLPDVLFARQKRDEYDDTGYDS